MKYHLDWIIKKFEQGERLKYIFFWGHQPNKDGSVSASCFSQWWEQPFVVDEIIYKTAEHWMMAKKAQLFGDEVHLATILACNSPAEAKKWGREVENFNAEIWDTQKYEIIKQGNIHKFSQNEDLKVFLLQTKDRILVEASPRDNIWGIGMGKSNPNVENPTLWKGENLLGFALMEARDELMKE